MEDYLSLYYRMKKGTKDGPLGDFGDYIRIGGEGASNRNLLVIDLLAREPAEEMRREIKGRERLEEGEVGKS